MKLLEEVYKIPLNDQVFKSAFGMNGAGRFGAQCGLVEGMIMFLGIWSSLQGISYGQIQELCNSFAKKFEESFGSLLCARLRPEAEASARDPDHACEELKVKAILMDLAFLNVTVSMVGPRVTGSKNRCYQP